MRCAIWRETLHVYTEKFEAACKLSKGLEAWEIVRAKEAWAKKEEEFQKLKENIIAIVMFHAKWHTS